MKKLLLLAVLTAACVASQAQTVYLNNTPAKLGGTGAPITDIDGTTKLAGTGFFAQLWAGKDASSLVAVGTPLNFLTGAGAGFVSGSASLTVAGINAGDNGTFQVAAWDSAFATPDAAKDAGGKYGWSNVFSAATGGAGVPPGPGKYLIGLQSFSLTQVPEPTTLALGALGAAALFLRRRS